MSVIASKYLGTNINRLAAGPDTLLLGNNIVNDDGQLRPRRGQDLIRPQDKPFLYLGSAVANRFIPIKCFFYNNRLWAYWRNDTDQLQGVGYCDLSVSPYPKWYYSLIDYRGSADYTMFQPAFVQADRRLLFASSSGIKFSPKLDVDQTYGTNPDTFQTTFLLAGCPRPLPFLNATTTDLAAYNNNWLVNNGKVAYVHVWRKVNANGTWATGPVSQRAVVTNSAGAARGVQLTIRIPKQILDAYSTNPDQAARYSCQIYRTYTSNPDATGTAPDPGAQFYMAMDIRPTTTQLASNFQIVINDMQADLTLQDPLYTNETQQGPARQRVRAPMARCLAFWQNAAWFGNTTGLWRNFFNIQAVQDEAAANKNGIRAGDVIVIADWAFQAVTGAPSTWQFQLNTTTGYTNQITRVLSSAQSLISQFNSNNNNNSRFTLHGLTGPNDFVGRMMLQQRVIGSVQSTFKPYIGLYRVNGWGATADAVPISPVPLVTSAVGKAYRIQQVACPGVGNDIQFTLYDGAGPATPDFVVGDTVNVARINGNQTAWPLIVPGQYAVKSIAGSVVTLDGRTYTSAVTYTIGAGAYVGYNLLGTMHCVKQKTTGATSQAIGDQDRNPNRVYYSPSGQPECAPLLNYFDFGMSDKAILAIVPLGETLFIFKQDGLYRVQGYQPNFYNSQFDPNISLMAPSAVCTMGGKIYALTTKGIFQITETDSKRISFDIQSDIDYICWNNPSNVKKYAFAASNTNDQRAYFWLPWPSSTYPDTCFVYDGFGWTKRTDAATSACYGVMGDVVTDQMRLYTAKPYAGLWLTKQRKTMTALDYSDQQLVPSTVLINGATSVNFDFTDGNRSIPMDANAASLFIGACIFCQGDVTSRAYITNSVYKGSNRFSFDLQFRTGKSTADWSGAASQYSVFLGYQKDAQYGITSQDPTIRSHWTDVKMFFAQPYFTKASLSILTDVNPAGVTMSNQLVGFAQGTTVFDAIISWNVLRNDTLLAQKTIQRTIPTSVSRGSQIRIGFSHNRACQFFSLYGFDVRTGTGGKAIERNNNA